MATKQFDITACLPVIYDNGSGGNPGDLHLPIGRWDSATGLTWITRALLKASISFAGMTAITSAALKIRQHTAAGWHAKGSGSVSVGTRRKTVDWSESSTGDSTATNELWSGSSGSLVTSGYYDDGDPEESINNGAADNTLETIDITEIVRAWFNGSPNYGLMLYAVSLLEANACEFYSRRAAGKEPYIEIVYESNVAPNAPTSLDPSGDTIRHTGRTITYDGTRSDPDSGDFITAYQVLVYTDASVLIQDSGQIGVTGSPTTFAKALTLPAGYDANTFYRWKARTRDKANVWGPYSALQRFKANSVPSTPAAPSISSTSTLTPTIGGGFSDPDPGDTLAAVQIEVEQEFDPGFWADTWLSGDIAKSGTTWSQAYGGTALAWTTNYRARVRTKDANGGYSSWSAWALWTTTQPPGPDNMSPSGTDTKQNSLTPTLTIGHLAGQFRNDQIEVRSAPGGGGTLLWSKAWDGADYANTNSKARTYAGTALAWGGTYYWRAQIESSAGVVGSWSDWYPFYINAQPTASPVDRIDDPTTGAVAVVGPNGVLVTTDSTPRIRATFNDPDRDVYGDAIGARSVEVRRQDTQAAHTGFPLTTGTTDNATIGTALTENLIYEARFGYRDNAGQPAGTYVYGPWQAFKYSRAPTATLTAPAGGSAVTDATPTLDWAYSSPTSKLQKTFRVEVFDKGPTGANYANEELVHDSGVVTSAASSYDVPLGVLADDHDYRWQVTVTDTDNLPMVLA